MLTLGVLLIAFFIAAPQRDVQGSVPLFAPSPASYQANILSDSQFVLGPSALRFDLAGYLSRTGSPLLVDAPLIEQWSAYASINPQVVLTVLEVDGRVSRGWPGTFSPSERARLIETLVMRLAERFYWHLYENGERAPQPTLAPLPLPLSDGGTAELISLSSGTYAVLDLLGRERTEASFARLVDGSDPASFAATWARLFPDSDALDASVSITPASLPPADLFQFPFPIGQTWWFNGAHNWNGSGATYGRPYSSIDFFTAADNCSLPPANDWAVAAAAGSGYHPGGYGCWYRVDHAGGWTTSYYHLRNVASNGPVNANASVGTIACETCAGGFATGPHVHFSLLYNGAYVELEGVELSGWMVRTGKGDYLTGGLERSGVMLSPYSSVLNEGVAGRQPTPTPTSTPAPSPTPTVTPGAPSAKYLHPPAGGLIRICPVNLVAEAAAPGGVGSVAFWVKSSEAWTRIGTDANGSDGWQMEWDCQDAEDGAAALSLSVTDLGGKQIIQQGGLTAVTIRKDCPEGTYRTAFFANAALDGAPASSWCKASAIGYNWGLGSPGAGVPGADHFSARFRGDFWFDGGTYRFAGESDDGVRVWVGRVLLVDNWRDRTAGPEPFEGTRALSAGTHEVRLDYYERTTTAAVRLNWERVNSVAATSYLPLVLMPAPR